MIFVHSRKDTAATAEAMIERATENETLHLLESSTQGAARAKFAKVSCPASYPQIDRKRFAVWES